MVIFLWRHIFSSHLVLLPLEPGVMQSYVSILRCENKFWKLMWVKTVNRLRLIIKLLLPLLIMHKTQDSCTCFLFKHGLLLHSSYTRWMCPWVKCWPQRSWTVMLPVCCMTSPTLAPLSFVLACTWSVPCVVDCFIANSFQLIVFLHR